MWVIWLRVQSPLDNQCNNYFFVLPYTEPLLKLSVAPLQKPSLHFENLCSIPYAGWRVWCAAWPSRQQRRLTATELTLATSSCSSSTAQSLWYLTSPTERSCWAFFLCESPLPSTRSSCKRFNSCRDFNQPFIIIIIIIYIIQKFNVKQLYVWQLVIFVDQWLDLLCLSVRPQLVWTGMPHPKLSSTSPSCWDCLSISTTPCWASLCLWEGSPSPQ